MWPIVQLGELCENILSGGTPSTESPEFWDNEIPWLSSADILNHKHYIIRKGVSKLWKPNILPKNNILVVTRVGLGKVIINNEDVCFSQDLQGLVLKSAIVDRNYLLYALLNKLTIFKQISRGATIKGVTRNDLISLKIPLPPLSIQQQIADTLDKADALRRKDQELLDKYDELAQTVFYEMFGDPVNNTKNWKVGNLVDTVQIKGGGTPKTSEDRYYGGSIPWISPKDMKTTFISNSIDKITEIAIAESSTNLIDPYCVLMVVRSGILKNTLPLAINTIPVALNQDMKSFKCMDSLNPYYLLYFLKAYAPHLLKSVRGTTADNISSDVIKKVQIQIPPKNLQFRFEISIRNIFAQKEKMTNTSTRSLEMFNGLSSLFFDI